MNQFIDRWYIGLDIATISGIAIYSPLKHAAVVGQSKGEPIYQLDDIIAKSVPKNLVGYSIQFVLEEPHHFQNATTTRSLISRYGYIKYSLMGLKYPVYEVNLNSARHWLGTKTKKETHLLFTQYFRGDFLTSDHTDALAVAMYKAHKDGYARSTLDLNDFTIFQMPKEGINAAITR